MKASSFAPPAAGETSAGPAEPSVAHADTLRGGPLLSVKELVEEEEVVGSELGLSGRTTGSSHGDLQSKKVFLTVNSLRMGHGLSNDQNQVASQEDQAATLLELQRFESELEPKWHG